MLVEEPPPALYTTKNKCGVSHTDRRNDKETAVIERRGRHSTFEKLMNSGKFEREAVETFPSAWMRTSDTLRAFAWSQITDYYSGSTLRVAERMGATSLYMYMCTYLRG